MRPYSYLFICLSTLFTLQACYQPKEGCLDIKAVNFDASADKDCCCEYPTLKMQVSQKFDDKVWISDSVYTNNLGLTFRLKSASFYFSDFSLLRNGASFPTEDTLSFQTRSNTGDTVLQTFINDFILVRRSPTTYSAGSFRYGGNFDGFQCRMGINENARRILPSLAPEGHPLLPQVEKLWQGNDTSYVAMRLVVQHDTLSSTVPDTLYFSQYDFDNFMIKQTGTFSQQTGYDLILQLKINYLALFRNVNWQINDKTAWKNSIIGNLPDVFSVEQ